MPVVGGQVGRGERGAVDAVPPGAAADHDHQVARAGAGWGASRGAGGRPRRRRPAGCRGSRGGRRRRRPPWAGPACCRSRRSRPPRPSATRRGCSTPAGTASAPGSSAGAKQSTSRQAIGRAETPSTSRTTPPTPVLAPPNGSSAEGWLWVSTLMARSAPPAPSGPSSKATMPALSTKAERTQGRSTASVAARRCWSSRPSIVRRSRDRAVGRPAGEVDAGPERLVQAVLRPGLGQRLQLGVGRRPAPRRRRSAGWPASRRRRATAAARRLSSARPTSSRSAQRDDSTGRRSSGSASPPVAERPSRGAAGRAPSGRRWGWPAPPGPAAPARSGGGGGIEAVARDEAARSGPRPSRSASASSSRASASVTPG